MVALFKRGRMKWTKHSTGYYVGWVDGKLWRRCRWVWSQNNGPIPVGMHIDHIDGNRANDSIANLQCVTASENIRLGSAKLLGANKSGYNGVSYHKASGKWRGQLRYAGRVIHCGTFHTPEEASSAVLAKRKELNAPTRRMASTGEAAGSRDAGSGTPRAGTSS